MELQTLRVGNWINNHIYSMATRQFEYEPVQVDVNILRILENSPKMHTYSPISLSRDLLKKLGFELKSENEWHLVLSPGFITVVLDEGDWSFSIYNTSVNFEKGNYMASNITDLKLHDLQNLCYSLTKKEFDINFLT